MKSRHEMIFLAGLLVLFEGEYKLVFWEDMTDIPDTITSAMQ